MADGDTITVGSKTYTFRTSINNATQNELIAIPVSIGDSGGDGTPSLPLIYTVERALAEAINGGFGSGTFYSSATTVHPDVTASYDNRTEALTITSKTGGAVSITLSESTGSKFTWAGSTLGGGSSGSAGTGSPGDILDWGNGASLKIQGSMSFGEWVKFFSIPGSYASMVFQGHNTDGSSGANDLYKLGVGPDGGGLLDLGYGHEHGSASAVAHTFTAGLKLNRWYYIGFSRDATAKTVKMYVGDGTSLSLIGTFSYSSNADGGQNTSTHLVIGNEYPSASLVEGGVTEEHYIWERAISETEHEDAMNGNPSLTGMVLGCIMGDDPEVDIAHGNIGTVTGTTLVQGH